MNRVLKYSLKRLAFFPLAMFLVITLAFALVNLTPGDPAEVIGGGLASPEQVDLIREELGLKEPLLQRYGSYLGDLAQGDLGVSFFTKRTVVSEMRQRFPDTIELVVMALVVATVIGVAIGFVAGYFRGRLPDRVLRLFISATQSVPDFFLGLLLIFLLFFKLGWAPPPVGRLGLLDTPPPVVTDGLITDSIIARDWGLLGTALYHSILPVLALGIFYSAYIAKTARATLGPAFRSKQVEFARASGLSEWKVAGYAFRQARTPIMTYGAILLAALIGGAAIVEIVFAWGGLGQWAIDRILKLDVPAIQGFILVTGLFTLVIYFVLDIVVAMLDPRVSLDEFLGDS